MLKKEKIKSLIEGQSIKNLTIIFQSCQGHDNQGQSLAYIHLYTASSKALNVDLTLIIIFPGS